MAEKKTKGRQKIEMKRIENENDRLVTFSKRRSGINKKISELITLTGSDVAFLVFSPAGTPFSFGHPSFESVTNRFLGQEMSSPNDVTHTIVEALREGRIKELNEELNEELHQLDGSKEKEKELKEEMKGKDCNGWWNRPFEGLNTKELREMEEKFKEFEVDLHNKIMEKTGASSSSHATQMPNPFVSINGDEANNLGFPFGDKK